MLTVYFILFSLTFTLVCAILYKWGECVELEEIFDMYYDKIYSFTLFRVQSIHDAEDITSNVFCKAVKSFMSYRKECSVSTWLLSIALNEIKNYYRGRREYLNLEYAESYPARENAEDSVLANERARSLYAAVAELDERQRNIVLLRYYGDMSNKEIALLLKLTETNVETILYRAKKILKKFLETCEVSAPAVSNITKGREKEAGHA